MIIPAKIYAGIAGCLMSLAIRARTAENITTNPICKKTSITTRPLFLV